MATDKSFGCRFANTEKCADSCFKCELFHRDYISREAAIQLFNEWIDDLDKQIDDSVAYPHLRSDYKVCKTQLLDCIHAINELPAADVRPVVWGRWMDTITAGIEETICSECGHTEFHHLNFCPNCGADMREAGTDG